MTVPAEPVAERRYVRRSVWSPIAFGPGMILGIIGALGVIVSLFMSWEDGGVHPSDIPVQFLWDSTPASNDPSLLILLVPFALVLAIGAFVPMGAAARVLGALAVLVVAGVFVYQLDNALGDLGANVGDVLDVGVYVAAVSALIGLVSGLLPSGWGTRREVVERDVVADRGV